MPTDPNALTRAQAKKRYAAKARSFNRPSDGAPFTVIRHGVTLRATTQGMESLFWPSIIDTDGTNLQGVKPGRFGRFVSTDHTVGAGGLFIQWGDNLIGAEGEWTALTRVYYDATTNPATGQPSFQTEGFRCYYMPHWDAAKPWFCYYSQATGLGIGQQQTLVAKTADFVTFTRIGIVLDTVADGMQPGDGHCGYWSPDVVAGALVGPALRGGGSGGTGSIQALYTSYDGVASAVDPVLLNQHADWAQYLPHNLTPTRVGSRLIQVNGQLLCIHGIIDVPGAASATSRLCWTPIGEDRKTLLTLPTVIFDPQESYEEADYRSFDVGVYDGKIILSVHYDAAASAANGASGTTSALVATYELGVSA